jgi:hypothetical protein
LVPPYEEEELPPFLHLLPQVPFWLGLLPSALPSALPFPAPLPLDLGLALPRAPCQAEAQDLSQPWVLALLALLALDHHQVSAGHPLG